MSYRAAFLQNFASPIGIVIAAGALVTAFKAGDIVDYLTDKPEVKPECVEVREPGAKLATYNPDCVPTRK